MGFSEKIADDAHAVFLNTQEFAEPIIYIPKIGSSKAVNAVVLRPQVDTSSQDSQRILHNRIELFISKDAEEGIASIDKGDDQVQAPVHCGEAPVDWVIIDILEEDMGMWHLLAEK